MSRVVKKVAVLAAMVMSVINLMACGSAVSSEEISEAQELLDSCDGICVIYGNNAERHSIAGVSYNFFVSREKNQAMFQVVTGPDGQKQGLENKTYSFQTTDEFDGLIKILKGMKPVAQSTDEITEKDIAGAEPYITVIKFKNKNYDLKEVDSYWLKTSKSTELEKYLKKVYDSCE